MATPPPAPSPAPAMESPPPTLDPVPATAIPPPTLSPSPLPPAVVVEEEEEEVEEKERPWSPPMKMKLAPYAMYRVFGGMGPAGTVLFAAYVWIHVLFYVVQFPSFSAAPERARFWSSIQTVVASACVAANALIVGVFICKYVNVDGAYVVREFDPSKQQPAEAAASELLPPPPPPGEAGSAAGGAASALYSSSISLE